MNAFQYPPGATPLDEDEIEGLKLKHVSIREELNRFEQDNINEALQWLESRRKEDILTERFIRRLHQKMFGKVWRWAGSFRRSGKKHRRRLAADSGAFTCVIRGCSLLDKAWNVSL